ncbi:hypothetical protein MKX01_002773, partial [Papaver californicum]
VSASVNYSVHREVGPKVRARWYKQFEQVWGTHVNVGKNELFPDAWNGPPEVNYEVDTMYVVMQIIDNAEFKKHLRAYAVKKGFQYKMNPCDKEIIKVLCKFDKSQSCQFFI